MDAGRLGGWGGGLGCRETKYRLGDWEGGWEAGIPGGWGWEAVRLGEGLGCKDAGGWETWEAGRGAVSLGGSRLGGWEIQRLGERLGDRELRHEGGSSRCINSACFQSHIKARSRYSRVRPLVKTRGRLFCFAHQQLICVRNVTPVG